MTGPTAADFPVDRRRPVSNEFRLRTFLKVKGTGERALPSPRMTSPRQAPNARDQRRSAPKLVWTTSPKWGRIGPRDRKNLVKS